MASTSFLPPSCLTLSGSAGWTGALWALFGWWCRLGCGAGDSGISAGNRGVGAAVGAGWLPGAPVCPKCQLLKVNNATVSSKSRNFIAKLRFSAPRGFDRLYPWMQYNFPKKFDAE